MQRIFLSLLLLFVSVAAAEEVSYAPEPDWLARVDVPFDSEIPVADVREGVHYLYFDRQIRVDPAGEPSHYFRYVVRITNQTGLESKSQINITFDPIYERIRLHRVNVIRDGQVIDHLRSTPLRLLDQETDLDQQLYNGTRTANLLLEDLRVGDILDYSYSYVGDNPIFGKVFNSQLALQWGVPVETMRLSLLWQKERPLTIKLINADWEFEHERTAAGDSYRLQIDKLGPLVLEDGTPDWFDPYPTVFITEQQEWREVVDWGRRLFRRSITANDEIRDVAREIRDRTDNDPDRVAAALQFVQNEIRYVGIELGINSHQASPAPLVLSRRYGDCKDKTSLMIAILRELDIDAYPALVNTVSRDEIGKRPPSMRSFDHVLVALPLGGKTYWLDPTRSHQKGSLDQVYQPDYGLALVLRAGETGLTPMQGTGLNSGYDVFEHYDFRTEKGDAVRLTVTTEYYGAEAERLIARFQRDSLSQIAQDYLEWYQNYYPGISSLHDPRAGIDIDSNRFKVEESYRIDDFWENQAENNRDLGWVYSYLTNAYIDKPDHLSRTQVYEIGRPVSIRHNLRLSLDDRDWSFENFEFDEDNEIFHYRVREKYDPESKILNLEYRYANKTDHVESADYTNYLAALDRANEQTNFGIYRFHESPETGVDYARFAVPAAFATLVLLIVGSVVLWRLDVARHPFDGEMNFYPVDQAKFVFLWIFTLGLYPIFWFYRLWRYEKSRSESNAMPSMRGFFFVFWFYPAYLAVARYLREKDLAQKIPHKLQFAMLALALLAVTLAGSIFDELWIPTLVASPLIALPLLSMVNAANGQNPEALKHNSRWSLRHAMLIPVCLPIYFYVAGSLLGVFPAEGIVRGDSLFGHHVRFMQRNQIIDPGDEVVYFYSNAVWNLRDDGNGFSQRHVFSYWRDENDRLNVEKVDLADIGDIEVHWAQSWTDITTVEVFRKDRSKVILYLSRTDRKDKLFVSELMTRWRSHQP